MSTPGVLRTFDIDGDEDRAQLEHEAFILVDSTLYLHGGYGDDYFVITADGSPYTPVLAAAAIAYSAPLGPRLLEFSIVVRPEHQRRGYARRLVEAVVEHAQEVGVNQVLAEVVNRDALIPLLQSLGFRADGEGFSGEYWVLDLAQPRPNGNLSDYFPDTAAGRLQPRRGEDIFEAGGIGYIGNTDGTMVPVAAENLEAMPENIWDADKLATLVEAAGGREQVLVYPGYADLWVEDGELCAQVRDGNHRTFAAIEAGSDFAWVMMSDSTRQGLDLREGPAHDALYRAIRKAQAEYGAPLFKRRRNTIRKGPKYDVLLAAEREHAALTKALDEALQAMILRFGAVEDTGYPLKEQLQRPDIFWRLRIGELAKQHGRDFILDTVYDSPEGTWKRELEKRRGTLFDTLFDLRKAAGLKHAERLDPVTGLVTHW